MNCKLNISLPDGFLNAEEREGYLISAEMKRIWAVELDLLNEFQRVARKHGLKYIANGGTMLGAVRHHGFIPWDDDIDLMMMRSEYDRLCRLAPQEFRHPYFFQTEHTDPGVLRCHAQLRNSETTAILNTERSGRLRFNQGIFIDIFPLDAVPDQEDVWEKECRRAQRYYELMNRFGSMSSHYLADPRMDYYQVKRLLHAVASPLWERLARHYFNLFERECRRFNGEPTQKLSLYCWGYKYKKLHRSRADHEETTEMDFEFLKVPVCRNYDHALTEVFGDWRTPVRDSSMHGNVLFDTERPYTYYLDD